MKKRVIGICAVILLVFISAACFVQAAGLYDGLEGDNASGDSHLDNFDNYYLDMVSVSIFKSPMSNAYNGIANVIFGGIKGIGAWTVKVVRFALSADVFDMVEDAMQPLFGGIKSTIFDELSILMIAAAGGFFLIMLLKRQMTGIVTGIGTVLIVIVLAAVFFNNPMKILSSVNEISTELSGNVLNAPYEAAYGEENSTLSAEDKSAELLWNIIVHKPWQILEFGDTEIAEEYEDEILALPGGDERDELVEKMNKETGILGNSQIEQSDRIINGLFFLIFSLIISIIIMACSLLIIGFQIFAIFLGLLGGFVLLLALVPIYGLRLVGRWIVKILSALTVKVALVFALAVLIVTMDFVFGLLNTYGIMTVMFTLISIVLILYIKRKSLFNMFNLTPGQAMNAALNANFNPVRDAQMEMNSFQNWQRNRDFKKGRKIKLENDKLMNEQLKFEKEMRLENQRQEKAEIEEASARINNVYASQVRSMDDNTKNAGIPKEHTEASTRTSVMADGQHVTYTKQQREAGIELLRENYSASKEQSETKARSLGKEPEYTTFVKRTDALRAMNPDAEFDRRDVEKMARMVQRTEAAGGTVEDLRRNTTANDQNVNAANRGRERRLSETPAGTHKETETAGRPERELKPEGSGSEHVRRENNRGIEYFKNNFGEEKGEKFYYSLSEKYGEENLQKFESDKKLSYTEVRRKVAKDVKNEN